MQNAESFIRRFSTGRNRLNWLRWPLLAGVLMFLPWLLYYSKWSSLPGGGITRMALFALVSGLAGVLLSRDLKRLLDAKWLSAGGLLAASAILLAQAFYEVVPYPFSLHWSEGNRFWDYSILFGRRLYDYPTGRSIFAYIDLGRQALWGLPFLFADITIREMRLWNMLMTTLPYAIFGWIIFKRVPGRTGLWFLAGLWTFCFLTQGPIYTPLVLCAALVGLAWMTPLPVALILIAVAGYLAQITRFTWMFAPAIWAGMLYFCEQPKTGPRLGRRQWACAAAGVIAGLVGGFALPRMGPVMARIQSMFSAPATAVSLAADSDLVSVNGISTVLGRQALLWERLLPNPTYGVGILLGLALAILPLIVLLLSLARGGRDSVPFWPLHPLQALALLAALTIFLAIGLVVSVKIGGGSNLHNLDMFLIALIFTAALAWEAGGWQAMVDLDLQAGWLKWIWVAGIGIYAVWAILSAAPLSLPSQARVNSALGSIREAVKTYQLQGEVLFLDQRQLLTFKAVPSVKLIPDYEKKYLMDQALSGDAAYFSGFYKDLQNYRFKLIVSEPLYEVIRGSDYNFGDENDNWVKWVSEPILCYYKPLATYPDVRVQLLGPRKTIGDCRLPASP
jgi:hypothetical protein